jgi:hypothetical protein
MQCSYSNSEIVLSIDPSIPVECPECSAIRKIPGKQVWSDLFIYPAHEMPDVSRERKRYKRINGEWQLVEKGE